MNITRGKMPGAQKIVIFGPEGIGKSTFASKFPDPLFIDTEESTKNLDVKRFDAPSSWQMLKSQVAYVISNPDVCKTLVLDTADWAERLEIDWLCNKNGWDGLEGAGYGKGYTYSAEEFGRLLDLFTEVVGKGINVVITAHAQLRKVELPEEMGAYDHWEMKTSKKVAPMIREWADAVFFANYKINVINVDKQGAAKGKNKAQGGRRVMYTNHTPFWDAKNRFGLPEELPFDYESIRKAIEADRAKNESKSVSEERSDIANAIPEMNQSVAPDMPAPIRDAIDASKKENSGISQSDPVPEPVKEAPKQENPYKWTPVPAEKLEKELDMRIPKRLRDLMLSSGVTDWDIMNICEAKGYIPAGTPLWDYEQVNPPLIDSGIIAYWDSVVEQIKDMYEKQQIPFLAKE